MHKSKSNMALSYGAEAEALPNRAEAEAVGSLTAQLTASLRCPTRRTLTLIDKALSYLTPFESPRARTANPAERRDLLTLLRTHGLLLSPYLDIARVESNLLYGARSRSWSCGHPDR